MRKIVLTLAALAAFGLALPAATGSASAETVIIKKGHRDHGWRSHQRHRVVIKERRRHHRDHVVVKERHRHGHGHGVGIVVR